MKTKTKSKNLTPGPKTRSKDTTCQKLVEAGLKVFCHHGYDAATTKLVAKESGVNESLINRYFHGKEGLLNTILLTFAESFNEKIRVYPPGQTVEEEIYNFCASKFEAAAQEEQYLKLMLSRSLIQKKTNSTVRKVFESTSPDGVPQILIDRLAEFQKKGLIRPDVNLYRAAASISFINLSASVFGYFQMNISQEMILKIFKDFAHDYAKGLIAK